MEVDGDKYPLGDSGIPKDGEFKSHRWVKTINDYSGIIALSVTACFLVIFITYTIVIVKRRKNVLEVWEYFLVYFHLNKEKVENNDKTRPARIFSFPFLAAGLVLVVFYNIQKMSNNPQVSLESLPNFMSPSILLCPYNGDKTSFNAAYYTADVNQIDKLNLTSEGVVNMTNYYEIVDKSNGIIAEAEERYRSVLLFFVFQ
ncbi:hypothetical protein Glove_78g18 [Diversispora epigaea]|uniref:Uncharacterized protein n=1 Tax=Diversispora epigaea TaxID=1348612 RepID=A0A397JB20_9GLOM|nr:hypothetical protein Glove_78g18 [Diversispora epigaea]